MLVSIILQVHLILLPFVAQVRGHGYINFPRSRNWYANEEGIEGSQPGVPRREYCPHCVNANNGVCGVSIIYDYDDWIDSQGNPMPWISQATYASGDVNNVASTSRTHHNGHMEIKGCPAGRASTQECFDDYVLTFVSDLMYPPTPPIQNVATTTEVRADNLMEILHPDSLVGEQVLLQVRNQVCHENWDH